MPRIKLVLSFDHELSLGGARSYEQNLFEPTRNLLKAANECGVPIALFTDVLCAMRFEEWAPERFCAAYRSQIHEALRAGNDVQLHLHPHWVDSTFSEGTFHPSARFALADFSKAPPPSDIRGIVGRGYAYLEALCREADPEYRCIAYRAGGYNLAPETQAILGALYESGIRIDSSIGKGYRFDSDVSHVDFAAMPTMPNWFIACDGPLNAPASSGIYEVPIATAPRTPLNNVPFLVKRVLHRKRTYDSGGWTIHAAHTGALERVARLFPRSAWLLGFDDAAQNLPDLLGILRRYMRAHRGADEILCAAIGHPKNMGSYALDLFRGFIEAARKEYGADLSFTTYRAIYDEKFGVTAAR